MIKKETGEITGEIITDVENLFFYKITALLLHLDIW